MSTLAQTCMTILDWAKRLDPQGKVDVITELLSQTNEILRDMLFVEGNLPTGDRATQRTSLPTVGWRLLNQGTLPSKSTTAQVDFGCAIMDAWSEVDVALANLGGNPSAVRLSEGMAFLEAMNQEMASTLFYGNASVDQEEFNGLSTLYNSPSAANGSNVLDAAGTGSDNTSIWLVGWGRNSIYGIFPRGSKAGIQHEDLNVQTIQKADGTRMRAYQEHWTWNVGVAQKDWRYVVRIGSIDVSDLTGEETVAADLIKLMIKAYHRLPNLAGIRPAWYMNRTAFEMLDIQRLDKVVSGGGIRYENVDGEAVPMFRGIPIRKCDAILNTEDDI